MVSVNQLCQAATSAGALMPRRRFYRGMFIAAGLYNFAWGLFSSLYPQWLFDFAGMPRSNTPEIFACLAMSIALYGFFYLDAARAPERALVTGCVGLLGKLLGPIGLAVLIFSGRWPLQTILLCLTNDLIWWILFGLFIRDAWRLGRERSTA